MKATQLLMVDHEEVMTMLDTLLSRNLVCGDLNSTDAALFLRVREALELHTKIGESVLYPRLNSFPETKQLTEESHLELADVKQLLSEMEPGVSSWDDQIIALRRKVQDHADEEEEKLFPEAERLLGEEELVRLGEEIQTLKAQHMTAA